MSIVDKFCNIILLGIFEKKLRFLVFFLSVQVGVLQIVIVMFVYFINLGFNVFYCILFFERCVKVYIGKNYIVRV